MSLGFPEKCRPPTAERSFEVTILQYSYKNTAVIGNSAGVQMWSLWFHTEYIRGCNQVDDIGMENRFVLSIYGLARLATNAI